MKTRIGSLLRSILYLNLLFFGVAAAVSAHHSFARYDHTGTVDGTVTKFQWTNPHAYLELDVTTADGKLTHYSIEMTSINMMRRLGWKSSLTN